ncbi:FAD-dependent oxidoreductase [Candidatus Fermentibacteria bacterium]|nr:FAD-dependent oxidoreductase [Candidatus Fermentibacteria bacterium]
MTADSQRRRIERHPILEPLSGEEVDFTFNGRTLKGRRGEVVSSALFASGIRIFGHHPEDGSSQGMFCANGQCSQCSVLVNGVPVKGCIVPLEEGMDVRSMDGLPQLPNQSCPPYSQPVEVETDVLVLGAGPSGMAAAIELGRAGVDTLIVDDKSEPGGKLVLQTHKFFGSVEDCRAGTRGIHLARWLYDELSEHDSVQLWLDSIALAVYSDGKVGVRCPRGYRLVVPRHILVATGARELSLSFPGNALPGVYGAGAFQTLVNRDRIRSSERLFVVGGGNVGLIAAYHALQADMTVVGLAEALPECGGYYVHADKIRRLGVPIYTRHTVVAAHGEEHLEAVTIAEVDDEFHPLPGTERSFRVDTLLVAVGLDPVDEFARKAEEFGIPVLSAGDAEEIAEASAAMFTGRTRGRQIACSLGASDRECPSDWREKAEVLKQPGGKVHPYRVPEHSEGVFPVLHCNQEIPCNPCITSCPLELIRTEGHPILGIPEFEGKCSGCLRCVAICPGLAVTLVDYRKDNQRPGVVVPFELGEWRLREGESMDLTDMKGEVLGKGMLRRVTKAPGSPQTLLLHLDVDASFANRVAGVRVQDPSQVEPLPEPLPVPIADDAVACRCERVTAGEIRRHLRGGVRDLNELKALTRAGFGACGGKTCKPLIARLCREEGIPPEQLEGLTERPLFAETRLGFFCGGAEDR